LYGSATYGTGPGVGGTEGFVFASHRFRRRAGQAVVRPFERMGGVSSVKAARHRLWASQRVVKKAWGPTTTRETDGVSGGRLRAGPRKSPERARAPGVGRGPAEEGTRGCRSRLRTRWFVRGDPSDRGGASGRARRGPIDPGPVTGGGLPRWIFSGRLARTAQGSWDRHARPARFSTSTKRGKESVRPAHAPGVRPFVDKAVQKRETGVG